MQRYYEVMSSVSPLAKAGGVLSLVTVKVTNEIAKHFEKGFGIKYEHEARC